LAQRIEFEDVKRILVDRVGLPEENVVNDPEASFEDMGLDSLAFVEIQLAIQQEYDIEIPDEDAEKLTKLGEGIEYVNQRLAEKDGG
jgi:acyl carrier protein